MTPTIISKVGPFAPRPSICSIRLELEPAIADWEVSADPLDDVFYRQAALGCWEAIEALQRQSLLPSKPHRVRIAFVGARAAETDVGFPRAVAYAATVHLLCPNKSVEINWDRDHWALTETAQGESC